MKIASWNVNSLKVRLPHLEEWLKTAAPDVVALQETKLEDAKFPLDALAAAGYGCVYTGQKTYNGVALLARTPSTVAEITRACGSSKPGTPNATSWSSRFEQIATPL